MYSIWSIPIRILETPRLHRRRKGRRKTVTVMDQEELAAYFAMPADAPAEQLQIRLEQAGWHYHRDAVGRLWSVAQGQADTEPDRESEIESDGKADEEPAT